MATHNGPGRQTPGRDTTTATLPKYTGCPCGCSTRLPWIDDPDCIRRRPMPAPRDPADYDVADLGLVPHDRERCGACQAVGA